MRAFGLANVWRKLQVFAYKRMTILYGMMQHTAAAVATTALVVSQHNNILAVRSIYLKHRVALGATPVLFMVPGPGFALPGPGFASTRGCTHAQQCRRVHSKKNSL